MNLAVHARNAIAGSIRGLVSYGRLDELEQAITRVVAQHGPYWPKALEEVQLTIRFDGKGMPPEGRERLDQWRQLLQPQSIPERLRLCVSLPAWSDMAEDEDGRSIDRAEARATALAEEYARDPQPWLAHLSVLLEGEQRKAIAFGQRLGQCLEEPALFIDRALMVLASLPRERANPTVLSAFLRGLKPRDPERVAATLHTVAEDRILCHYLVDLTRLSHPALSDLQRLLHVVRREGMSPTTLSTLSFGSVLDHLPPDDLIVYTDHLLTFGSEGAWVALDILFMYQYGADERWLACKQQFRKLLLHPDLNFLGQWREGDLYHWQVVVLQLLDEEDHDLARDLMQKMIAASAGERSPVALEGVFRPVLQVLLTRYSDAVWPMLSEALLSDDVRTRYYVTDILGARFAQEDTSGALFTVPDDFLLEWCARHPTRAPAALARIMPLFQRTGDTWTWRPLAQAVIDRYGDQKAVLSALTGNIGTYSWTGSLVPYYERQVHPMEQLRHHRLPEVRRWAGEHLRYVQEQIKQETTRDDERNLGIF